MINKLINYLSLKYNSKKASEEDIKKNQNDLLNIFEESFAHKKSYIKKQARIEKDKPVPWFTYPAIEFLESLNLSSLNVFEYGSGIGTLYWLKNSKSVTSVESDTLWYEKVNKLAKLNSKNYLLETTKSKYIKSIARFNKKFDIVVIDGVYRYDCALQSIKYVKNNGVVILDNAEWYPKTSKMLREKGFKQIDFSGFGPVVYFTWKTSFFIKSVDLFKYKKDNYLPVGGYRHNVKPE
jgi:predicted O-methyltransferase YrrM